MDTPRIRCAHCKAALPPTAENFIPSALRFGVRRSWAICRPCTRLMNTAEQRKRRAQLRNDPAYRAEQDARYAARVARRAAEQAEPENAVRA
ncbi:hypothetical protein ABZU25_33910 [Micromonospora sp. NPDC005215]|uniref:hypothetical protein n=1 Tax=Micromonospora sp. NPDC005215 TaxID=3157024 RepID=UPI0033B98795